MKLAAKDNPYNKFYVAQWIPHLFDQSMIITKENDLHVTQAISELLTNNVALL
jgi:hypothetical protein